MEITALEKTLAATIRRMMKESKTNRTQKDLAAALGMTQPYMSQIMTGKKSISVRLLVDICLLYGKVPVITFEEPCEKPTTNS